MEPRFIYITCASHAQALEIGQALVGARLAACANVLPGMTSVYWWEGKVVQDSECVLVLKSRVELVEALVAQVKALHSYTVPCVVALPILEGNPDYLRWLSEETGGAKPD